MLKGLKSKIANAFHTPAQVTMSIADAMQLHNRMVALDAEFSKLREKYEAQVRTFDALISASFEMWSDLCERDPERAEHWYREHYIVRCMVHAVISIDFKCKDDIPESMQRIIYASYTEPEVIPFAEELVDACSEVENTDADLVVS